RRTPCPRPGGLDVLCDPPRSHERSVRCARCRDRDDAVPVRPRPAVRRGAVPERDALPAQDGVGRRGGTQPPPPGGIAAEIIIPSPAPPTTSWGRCAPTYIRPNPTVPTIPARRGRAARGSSSAATSATGGPPARG